MHHLVIDLLPIKYLSAKKSSNYKNRRKARVCYWTNSKESFWAHVRIWFFPFPVAVSRKIWISIFRRFEFWRQKCFFQAAVESKYWNVITKNSWKHSMIKKVIQMKFNVRETRLSKSFSSPKVKKVSHIHVTFQNLRSQIK